MTTPAPTIDAKTTTEYAGGRQAFLDGKSNDASPHPKGASGNNAKRQWWLDGWYDAKLKPLHDRLDAKCGTPIELREGRWLN